MNRRDLISAFLGTLTIPSVAAAQDDSVTADNSYKDYDYQDYFDNNSLGTERCPSADIQIAREIVATIPADYSPYQIMLRLQGLAEKNAGGEPFNGWWKVYANPLIVFMFNELRYSGTRYPDDNIRWCAACLSWCLLWGGYEPPKGACLAKNFWPNDLFEEVQEPFMRGDICVFRKIGDPSHGHVGFWHDDQKNVSPGFINVLGGNQSYPWQPAISPLASQVCVRPIAINKDKDEKYKLYLLAIIRPKNSSRVPASSNVRDLSYFDMPCGTPNSNTAS